MGVLILGGTVTLAVLIVQRMRLASGGGVVALHQPEGSRIAGIAASEGRLAVWVERPDGARVLWVDVGNGRVLREMRLGE